MCCHSSSNNAAAPSAPGSGTNPPGCTTAPCPLAVTVVINLSQPVACPGHPLSMTAVGTPSGGTFAWTISGAGELVDGAGAPVGTGDTVNLRSFQPDDVAGKIPEKAATVTVAYTHPNGTATDSKPVKIHKIDFEVTDTVVTGGVTQANESRGGVTLGAAVIPTMSTNPKVKIKLDASCPRKTACAQNHQVGFLQTLNTDDRRVRYTHTLTVTHANFLPMRDQINGPKPFYQGVTPFAADNDQLTVHHEDSPRQGAAWIDPRSTATPPSPAPPPPKNQQLRQVFFANSFTVWLVVQNIEWAAHHKDTSFVFLRNFSWSMHLDVTVNTAAAPGSFCTPRSNPAIIGAVGVGKGGTSPTLSDSFPNHDHTVTTNPAPGI